MLQQVFEGLIVNIIKTRQHRVDCCPAAAATLQSQSVRSGIQKVASSDKYGTDFSTESPAGVSTLLFCYVKCFPSDLSSVANQLW